MKRIICLVLSSLLAFSIAAPVSTVSAKKACVCKHAKAKKHHYRTYYAPGYCEEYSSACGRDTVCYSGHYYKCYTDFYYHRGRNTSRVEICH